jgi:hypothetical protein
MRVGALCMYVCISPCVSSLRRKNVFVNANGKI